jgi:carbon-monoxide dehydrogenase small subunit
MHVRLSINGRPMSADVDARTILVDLIRDRFGLTGTKVGCDTGQCGSCAVLVDGRSAKSCSVLAAQVDGGDVTTIEGINDGAGLSELQNALWEQHGVQCGFCTPGIVVSLTDLLEHNPKPGEAEIRDWLAGNLCRCTGYQSIVRAVLSLANGRQADQTAGGRRADR